MLVRPLTPRHENTSVIVRYTLDGVRDHVCANAVQGAEIPDGAKIIDIAFEPSDQQTQQIVWEPAWPGDLHGEGE
jgi:hypothetical protein